MDVFRMRCFVSVAKNKSLTKASHEMLISQPAMTVQMNGLESELGVKLLVRGKQTVLTAEGEYALREIQGILSQIDAMGNSLRAMNEEGFGKISIGFHGPSTWAHFDRLIRAFSEKYPRMQLDIVNGTWAELRGQLERRELDVALLELSEVEGVSGIASMALFTEEPCAVVPKDSPLASRESVTVDDMKPYNIIVPNYRVAERYMINCVDQLRRDGLEIKNYCRGNGDVSDNVLVSAGLGVAFMPRSHKVKSDDFVCIDLVGSKVFYHYGIAWREQSLNPAVEQFVGFTSAWDWDRAKQM